MLKVLTPRSLRILARARPVARRGLGEAPLPMVRYSVCFDAEVPFRPPQAGDRDVDLRGFRLNFNLGPRSFSKGLEQKLPRLLPSSPLVSIGGWVRPGPPPRATICRPRQTSLP